MLDVISLRSVILVLLFIGCGGRSLIEDDPHAGEMSSSSTGGTSSHTPALPNGHYVVAVSGPAYPTYAILFDGVFSLSDEGLRFTLQPLSAHDRQTLVASSATFGPFSISPSGTYVALVLLDLPVEAIPWPQSHPAKVRADLRLEAQQPTCGTVSGEIHESASFPEVWQEGTFALALAAQPDAYTNAIVDCDGTRAAPLP